MHHESNPHILAVSAVIQDPQGNILLHTRTKEPDAGTWELIAGFVEPGERLTEAVARKVTKKTGITETDSITFTGKYYDDPDRHPGSHCIPFIFEVQVSVEAAQSVSDENRWFTPVEIRDLPMAMDNKQTLKDLGLLS